MADVVETAVDWLCLDSRVQSLGGIDYFSRVIVEKKICIPLVIARHCVYKSFLIDRILPNSLLSIHGKSRLRNRRVTRRQNFKIIQLNVLSLNIEQV